MPQVKTKTLPRKRKPKKFVLKAAEQRILEYPPNPGTWICERIEDAPIVNTGSDKICWHCGNARPSKPKLLWIEYERACFKVGIDPVQGLRWKIINGVPMMREKGKRWKTAPPIEGL